MRAWPHAASELLSWLPSSSPRRRVKVVVLNVWATWCPPCREELPRLEQEIWQRFRQDVAVVAVAREEDAAKLREFNKKANLTFSLVPDPRGSITHRYGGKDVIPRTYVITRE
ncbi:MAG: TlpA disulfide reductase family protein, partial [Thermoanaerobaculia bacterium]